MPQKKRINASLFIAGWLTCLTLHSVIALVVAIAIVIVHFLFVGQWQKEREILLITLILGCLVDSVAGNFGLLEYTTGNRLLPGWMACVWLLAGTTIRHSLSFCSKRPWLAALVGFGFALVHYSLVQNVADVPLRLPFWASLGTLSVVWSVMVPVIMAFSTAWYLRYKRSIR